MTQQHNTIDMFESASPTVSAVDLGLSIKRALVSLLRNGPLIETPDKVAAISAQEKMAQRLERQISMGVHYKSEKDQWSTPQDFFDEMAREFPFQTDVCALPENAKCANYFTPAHDGLAQEWTGVCWMNPPYGRKIGPWIQKAYESSLAGATVACLLPARTDTKWWHAYCTKGEIRYIKGRLKFGGCKDNAPFPCAVVIFRPPAVMTD